LKCFEFHDTNLPKLSEETLQPSKLVLVRLWSFILVILRRCFLIVLVWWVLRQKENHDKISKEQQEAQEKVKRAYEPKPYGAKVCPSVRHVD
jgi:hypothetical protein